MKNFNLRNAYKILDCLMKNDNQILTPLSHKIGINYQICKNYVIVMEDSFEWLKTEKIKDGLTVKLTHAGREFLWKLRELF